MAYYRTYFMWVDAKGNTKKGHSQYIEAKDKEAAIKKTMTLEFPRMVSVYKVKRL